MNTKDFIDELVIDLAVKRAPTAEVGDSGAKVANNVANYATRIINIRNALRYTFVGFAHRDDMVDAEEAITKIINGVIDQQGFG